MQSTSGWAYSIHSSTRGSRAPSELTFHVAMRTSPSPPSTVGDHEEEVGLAGHGPVHRRPAVPRAGSGRQPAELDLEFQGLPRHHLAAEPRLVDAAEQRQLAAIALVGEHGDPAELGERLDHE